MAHLGSAGNAGSDPAGESGLNKKGTLHRALGAPRPVPRRRTGGGPCMTALCFCNPCANASGLGRAVAQPRAAVLGCPARGLAMPPPGAGIALWVIHEKEASPLIVSGPFLTLRG